MRNSSKYGHMGYKSGSILFSYLRILFSDSFYSLTLSIFGISGSYKSVAASGSYPTHKSLGINPRGSFLSI